MRRNYLLILILAIVAVCLLYAFLGKNLSSVFQTAFNSGAKAETTETNIQSEIDHNLQNPQNSLKENDFEPVMIKDVEIIGNTAEYSLKCSLYKDADGSTYLKLDYYLNGISNSRLVKDDILPDMKLALDSGKDLQISVYLNPVYEKVYIRTQKDVEYGVKGVSVIGFPLGEGFPKNIFLGQGAFSPMSFSKDFKYLAFSYFVLPAEEKGLKLSLLQILSCEKDVWIVDASKAADGIPIGQKRDVRLVYSHNIQEWTGNSALKLKEYAYFADTGAQVNTATVIYDISKNMFLNEDGTAIGAQAGGAKTAKESGALKTLKAFYEYLPSKENHSKAMELLDPDFTMQLDLLRQFGITSLKKSDISLENASIYYELLKTAEFDKVVKEETIKNSSTIYYYHKLVIGQQQVRQALKTQLVFKDDKWRITAAEECKTDEKPFAGT